jgi:glycosyltransferase involved in cell wall biosynthesis
MPKLVTVFRGPRDLYQVPLALHEHGYLARHVSEWYSPLDHPILKRVIARQGRLHAFLARRYCAGLPSSAVSIVPPAFVSELTGVMSRGRMGASLERVDAWLGSYAGAYARLHESGLLSYSYYAFHAFHRLGNGSGQPRVVFQVHPHPITVRRLLRDELAKNPDCRDSLSAEQELQLAEQGARFRQLATEPELADLCVVNSTFTKHSLVENGVSPNKIKLVPYGVDVAAFRPGSRPDDGRFRVLFVGSLIQRKGIKYLLEAWKQLALPNSQLILAGRGQVDSSLLSQYRGLFTHLPNVPPVKLVALYQQADLFCLPSLVEGFGLVLLEALACGTPVVASTHTGAVDLLDGELQRLVVEPGSVAQLSERLRWCYDERCGRLAAMRPACRALAENHSWAAFRDRLTSQLRPFLAA